MTKRDYCRRGHLMSQTRVILSTGQTCCGTCRKDTAAKYRAPATVRARRTLRDRATKFGLSIEELRSITASGKCAICAKSANQLDHDHATGHVRGLLCKACNLALGFFRDDVVLLRKAIEYLS